MRLRSVRSPLSTAGIYEYRKADIEKPNDLNLEGRMPMMVGAMFPFRWVMHRKRGLRMVIVRMLAGSPKNGVELMGEIEKMTQGWWRPSPGSIYPVLEQLKDEGLIKKKDDGRYELTEKAQDEMEWSFGPSFRKPRSIEETIAEVSGFVSYVEEVSKSDPEKIEPYAEKLADLADRLSSTAKKRNS
jgi:DNA-binding PadR family transcriptional regulator